MAFYDIVGEKFYFIQITNISFPIEQEQRIVDVFENVGYVKYKIWR